MNRYMMVCNSVLGPQAVRNQTDPLPCVGRIMKLLRRLLLPLLTLMETTTDWRSIESRVEMILMSRGLEYNLPVKLDGVKPESQQILLEYLDEHKWELEYQQAITDDDSSCLAFFEYATKKMREKWQICDELEDIQDRSGGVNAIILIAVGTLIWLIS